MESEIKGGWQIMAVQDFKSAYKTIMDDHFTPKMEISFTDGKTKQTLFYEKVSWTINNVKKGLRYGENPGQEAALYKLVNGNLCLGDVKSILPGKYLASDVELLQSGKHPGKTNITDVDSALNILRYLTTKPCCIIIITILPVSLSPVPWLKLTIRQTWPTALQHSAEPSP